MRLNLRSLWRCRPRLLTVTLLIVIASILVLANLSHDIEASRSPSVCVINVTYGWPLLWRQSVIELGWGSVKLRGEQHSSVRFAGNLALWLAILAAPAGACEWLVRRYRPRLRWSLRTMLAVVGLTAVLCGWFVAARKRADVQDALIAAVAGKRATLWADRLGPKWLDVVGTERFRRYIVGVSFESGADKLERDGAFVRLEQLSDLRYFNLVAERLTPGMADALRGTRRLRMLSINASSLSFRKYNDEPVLQDCFASIGQMTKLEHLYLDADDRAITSECLAGWARLANLKSLALNAVFVNEPPLLKHLPALPQVEFVDLSDSEIGDEDLRFLAALPALKSLILADTDVTGAGLEKLASFEFLEELTIGADAVSPAGLESLLPVKRLRKLHIDGVPYRREYADPAMFAELAIDDEDVVLVAEGNLAGCQRALEALRHSKPSIVIDHVWDTCGQSRERMLRMIPPYSEHESSRSALELMVHQWLQQSKAPN